MKNKGEGVIFLFLSTLTLFLCILISPQLLSLRDLPIRISFLLTWNQVIPHSEIKNEESEYKWQLIFMKSEKKKKKTFSF